MKHLLSLLFSFFVLLISTNSYGSHVAGGNITWTCTGTNTYLLTLTLYRDCGGITLPNSINTNVGATPSFTSSQLSISNSCGLTPTFSTATTLTLVSTTEVSQLCPAQIAQSECNGGSLPGMEEYVYQTEITLPDCDCWTFSYTLCCRNNAITNLANPSSDYSTIQSTLCNGAGPSCNNGPVFTAQPIPFICNNVPFCYDYGVVEPDGNTLSYSFTSALNSGNPSGYAGGYNANSPIPGITIDANTGQICFTPTVNGNFVVTIMVTETDAAGNVIGTYMQDIQFVVQSCPNTPPAPPTSITNSSGSATITGSASIQLCNNDNFCADITFTDTDAANIVSLTSNITSVLPGATVTFSNGNPATATVCWTDNIGGPAFYSFTIDAEDDACPIPGINSYTVDVTVLDPTDPACFNCTLTGSLASQTNASCDGAADGSLTISASLGTPNYQYSIDGGTTWQTSPTFNALSAGSYTVTIEDADNCQVTVPATITAPNPLAISLDASTLVSCNGLSDGALTVSGSGGTTPYQFSIDGGTTLQSSGTFNNLADGSYTLTIIDDNGCQSTVSGNVSEPSLLTASIVSTTDATCGLANGALEVAAAGGTPNYQYSIDGGVNWQNSGAFSGYMPGSYDLLMLDDNGCQASITVVINDLSGLTASISNQTDLACHGDNNAEVTIVAGGSTAPYSYSIDGGNSWLNTGTYLNLSAGNYNIITQDDNGCQFPVAVVITEPSPLTGALDSLTNISCNSFSDGEIIVSAAGATPSYGFSIDGGTTLQNSGTFSGLTVGNYTITIIDDNSCQTTISANLTEPTAIALNTNSTSSNCGQADGLVGVTASGGTVAGDYSYSWSQSGTSIDTNAIVAGLVAGAYDITVTDDNGCTSSSLATITDIAGGTASAVQDLATSCFGSCDGQATATITGGSSPYTYLWASGSTPNAATTGGLCGGTHVLTVTDNVGCIATATVIISEPDSVFATATVVNETCLADCQGSITISATGGTNSYEYSFDGGTSFSTSNYLAGLCANNYSIVVKDANGCLYTFSVDVLAGASYADATITPFGPLCESEGPQPLAGVSPGGTWLGPGVTANTFDPSAVGAGTFTITYEISSACGDTSTVDVTVLPLPVVSFIADIYSGCEPVVINFTSTGDSAVSCLWDFGDGNTSYNCNTSTNTYTSAGVYDITLAVTDPNGCENTHTEPAFIEVFPLPEATFSFSPQTASIVDPTIYFTDLSTNAASWNWDFSIGTSNQQNPVVNFENYGTYNVELVVYSDQGCTDVAYNTIEIEDQYLIYIPNAFTPNSNGQNDIFLPVSNAVDQANYDFYIFNRWGELIFESHFLDKGWDGTYNGALCPQDVYVYKIVTRDVLKGQAHEYTGHVTLIR